MSKYLMVLLVTLSLLVVSPAAADAPPDPKPDHMYQPANPPPVLRFDGNAQQVVEWFDAVHDSNVKTLLVEAHRLNVERETEAARIAAATTTTTTTIPVTAQPVASAPVQTSEQGSGRCGGRLPPCYVMHRESGGDIRIWNGGCYAPIGHRGMSPCGVSSASGKWQAIRSSWGSYQGYLNAADAPESVQDDWAAALWAGGAGCSHWSACG